MDDVAIKISNVSKSFALPHNKKNSLKGIFTSFGSKTTYTKQEALKDIDIEIKKGEFFGIVGRNGSGKSTLLKILAGIYQPTNGKVHVNGKLVPFIELGVGFNPELTGRENIYLNGAMLGFSTKEIDKLYDKIVDFAELKKYIDQKLKNYSSGMQVRLAFACATMAEADILLVDEVLAVGDEAFQRKCYQYFDELKRQKRTVILVTHSMDVVQKFCSRAMLIDKDHKVEMGNPMKISQIYQELNEQKGVTVNNSRKNTNNETECLKANMNFSINNSEIEFVIELTPKENLDDPIVALEIYRISGEQVIRWVTDEKMDSPIKLKRNRKIKMVLKFQNIFPVGSFTTRLLIRKRDRSIDYGIFNDMVSFEIKNRTTYEHNVFWVPTEKINIQEVDE
jgi:ABC-2 type transport system ATP-binding protein